MAKYEINHTCGHTTTQQIVGTNVRGERDNKVAWYESRECTECYRAGQLKAAQKQSAGLPTLSGSDKQVAWAETIRADKGVEIEAFLSAAKNRVENAPAEQKKRGNEQLMAIEGLIVIIKSKSQAKYWIDNRATTAQRMIKNEQ